MGQSVDGDVLDEFGAPGGSLNDFLAEEVSTDEEQSELPAAHDFDPAEDRELTLYGAMRLATEVAVDALTDKTLTPQADALRVYLADLRKELYR